MPTHDDLRAPTHDDLMAAANRHRCQRCGKPGAIWMAWYGASLCADCRHSYSIYHGANRKLAEELEPGVWRQFNQVRPNRASEFGYLVVLPDTRFPILAQFDEESKRFKVYCPQIGKDIQVPVKMWFAIPDPSK